MSKAAELAALIGSQTALSNRNLIINGAMQVAQRGTSFTGVTATQFGVDRFNYFLNNSGTFTVEQSTDAPDGFSNSIKLSCTVADASLAAGDYDIFQQRIEGQNLQHLQYGTSDAKKVTLSFWVKSNLTGNFVAEIQAVGNGYKSIQYSINSANTWEYKTLTYTGLTTATIDNDNTNGLEVSFWLAAGSNYSSGTHTDDTWNFTGANRAAGLNQNLSGSTSNTWQITGVQLEVGETATPFEHRSYADELARCQRYFARIDGATASTMGLGVAHGLDNDTSTIDLFAPVRPMRASMTVSKSSNSHIGVNTAQISANATNVSFSNQSNHSVRVTIDHTAASGSSGGSRLIRFSDASAYIHFDAEL